MDVNILQLLGLEELFGEGDRIFEVEDILDNVTLPPMVNPWFVPPPPVLAAPVIAPPRSKGMRGALGLALNILIYMVCAAVIAVSLILRFSGYNDSIMGYHIYHVVSGSMTPTAQADGKPLKGAFRVNDAIIVKNAAPEQVQEGDIITFWPGGDRGGDPWTHRVMEVLIQNDRSILFRTKGDANPGLDPDPVPGDSLIGVKVLTLPKLGGALKAAREHPWITVGISAGVMGVVFTMYIVTVKRAGKKAEE